MSSMQRLASRKLLAAVFAIAAVAANRKWGLGLTPDEIQSITDIALAAIGSQAGIDLAERALPLFTRSVPATDAATGNAKEATDGHGS
ncbi:conserved hypothetical protein [Solidesulfovibrio fructosivorans JJ]]|uniref:Uncharacterized protein n=1 Tax=Solidesulfovibrio fructosivorans JJ] TaxID=596151 RepID=E1JVE7_SOLFR|nr:hypothetical protein [Solidesulfovibrio fructosivorans]EFL51741.1 conserved hypothetical protein [Solidesulfovibrio fructosivorans JJ]]